jgi:hypothetical protein
VLTNVALMNEMPDEAPCGFASTLSEPKLALFVS